LWLYRVREAIMKKEQGNWEILLRYLRGELSPKEENDLKVRMESDKDLAEDLNLLEALQFVANHPDEARNLSVIQDLSARQIREYRKSLEPNQEPYGITISDSGLLPSRRGVRRVFDTETKDTRRLKFRIGDLALLLTFYPISSETFRIQGQLLGIKDLAPVIVRINSGTTEFEDTCDECYLFEFERVPALKYALRILHEDKTIGCVDFEL
jgi:hypothetical protein